MQQFYLFFYIINREYLIDGDETVEYRMNSLVTEITNIKDCVLWICFCVLDRYSENKE